LNAYSEIEIHISGQSVLKRDFSLEQKEPHKSDKPLCSHLFYYSNYRVVPASHSKRLDFVFVWLSFLFFLSFILFFHLVTTEIRENVYKADETCTGSKTTFSEHFEVLCHDEDNEGEWISPLLNNELTNLFHSMMKSSKQF